MAKLPLMAGGGSICSLLFQGVKHGDARSRAIAANVKPARCCG